MIIDLILYYLKFNQMYVGNGLVYKKIDSTIISYYKLDTVKNELFINFQQKIVPFF